MRFLLLACLLTSTSIFGQLTLTVTSIPNDTPAGDDIYVAGSFNTWTPGNAAYKLTHQANGNYTITLNIAAGNIEFKFTRGSWATVEGNASGGVIPNRTYNYSGGTANVNLTILSWEDLGGSGGNTTAADNVAIMSNTFYMPQLNKNRRIWIYLPPDYNSTNKHYPVLYMQDGQNIFDDYTSFSGEWGVDETLNTKHTQGDYGCIVVAVDNGGADRLDEYSPWLNSTYNEGGDGDEYMAFMVETLKPYIDNNYRTLPNREYTGIMGSSLGGLISEYGAIKYQDIYSKVGLFSSAYWFNPQVYNYTQTTGKEQTMKFYMLVGGNEEASDEIVTQTEDMRDILIDEGWANNTETKYVYKANGTHSESFWGQEFGAAYEWLFGSLTISAVDAFPTRINFFPNPTSETLRWETTLPYTAANLYDLEGKLLKTVPFHTGNMDVSSLPNGLYILRITAQDGTQLWQQKIEVAK